MRKEFDKIIFIIYTCINNYKYLLFYTFFPFFFRRGMKEPVQVPVQTVRHEDNSS